MSVEGSLVMVVPGDVDDPERPSGGNTYDRRLREELSARGWQVDWRPVRGDWPHPAAAARSELRRILAHAPHDSVVLVDGLVACAAPEVVVPAALRHRLVVLVHMPLGLHLDTPRAAAREACVLRACAGVVVTSRWCREWLVAVYGLEPSRVGVAVPGTDRAEISAGSTRGTDLLCVAAVTHGKGYDVLLDALAQLTDRTWRCECVGTLVRDPGFVARLGVQARAVGLASRFVLAGARTGAALEASYRSAGLVVLPSRAETWGMVIGEALAHGLPVVASDVGGVPEALGATAAGTQPGLLVPAGDGLALARALRRWLEDPDLRGELRVAALQRRPSLPAWSGTADRVANLLLGARA